MKCIVCEYDSWQYLFPARDRMFGLPGTFSENRCTNCGLVRVNPVPKNIQEYYPPKYYYSYTREPKKSFFGALRSYLITHKLFALVPAIPQQAPGRLLDIGCGNGDTLVLLKMIGWDVYGIDIDRRAIEIARKRGIRNASLGTYKDLNKYPDGFFDVIRMYHVIEHLDDPNKCLSLAYRKLKKGGEIIIGTPNVGSTVARLAKQYWYNLDCPRHMHLFTPGTLGKLVKRRKFIIKDIFFGSAGGWVGSIQYMLEETLSRDIDFINNPFIVILFYPLEWILDKLRLGDVFVLYAKK